MSQPSERLTDGITRRDALKASAALASGLAGGGAAIGTVGATQSITTRAFSFHNRVRAADDSDPGSPKPDPQDLLVERARGNPVDDGNTVALDGTHQLRWGELSAVEGQATVECVDGGTAVTVELTGLVPNELYSVWINLFESPGFVDTRNLSDATQNRVGVGSLGSPDGSENVFRARGSTGSLEVFHPNGDLSLFGSVEDCLLSEYEVHLVGIFHLDNQTHGGFPGPRHRCAPRSLRIWDRSLTHPNQSNRNLTKRFPAFRVFKLPSWGSRYVVGFRLLNTRAVFNRPVLVDSSSIESQEWVELPTELISPRLTDH